MTDDARELATVRVTLLVVAAVAWGALLLSHTLGPVSAHGLATHTHGALPLSALLQMPVALNPPTMLADWALMLVAMMSPALILPLHHIRIRSFTRRRRRAVALFVAAYATVWLTLGAALAALGVAVAALAPQSYLPAVLAIVAALVWQCSPIKQRCLNRCHAHPELSAFGVAADIDVLRFGAVHGLWCVGSCWLLMLFPLLLPHGHLAAMAAVTVLILSERLERPTPPRWDMRGLGKATRIVVERGRSLRAVAVGGAVQRWV